MKTNFKRMLLIVMCLAVMPVTAAAISRSQANTAANNYNAAIRNYNKQVKKVEKLKERQEKTYAKLLAKQEAAEAKFIDNQRAVLTSEEIKFNSAIPSLRVKMDSAEAAYNDAKSRATGTVSVPEVTPSSSQPLTSYAIAYKDIDISEHYPKSFNQKLLDLLPIRKGSTYNP